MWISVLTPAAVAASATWCAPRTLIASKRCLPFSMPTAARLMTIAAPRTAAGDRIAVAHIGLHRHHLADVAERLQMAGEIGAAHGDADAVAGARQQLHDLRADKARATENSDQLGVIHRAAPLKLL